MPTRVEELFAQSSFAAPDRIVVATALTDLEYLAPEAIAQAQAAHAELIFVHALVPGELPVKATYYNPLKADRDARLTLEVLARHIRARGLQCATVVRHGAVRDVLDEVIQERAAGRLLIGNGSQAVDSSARLGSVARQLLTHQWIPVSCTRPRQGESEPAVFAPRKILYPIPQEASKADHAHLVHDLTKYFHSELLVLHEGKKEQAADRVAGHCALNCPLGLQPSAQWIAGEGIDAKLILATAEKTGADLIVLDGPALFDPEGAFGLLEELLQGFDGHVLVAQSLMPKCDASSLSALRIITPAMA